MRRARHGDRYRSLRGDGDVFLTVRDLDHRDAWCEAEYGGCVYPAARVPLVVLENPEHYELADGADEEAA